eukprot:g37474.t1
MYTVTCADAISHTTSSCFCSSMFAKASTILYCKQFITREQTGCCANDCAVIRIACLLCWRIFGEWATQLQCRARKFLLATLQAVEHSEQSLQSPEVLVEIQSEIHTPRVKLIQRHQKCILCGYTLFIIVDVAIKMLALDCGSNILFNDPKFEQGKFTVSVYFDFIKILILDWTFDPSQNSKQILLPERRRNYVNERSGLKVGSQDKRLGNTGGRAAPRRGEAINCHRYRFRE